LENLLSEQASYKSLLRDFSDKIVDEKFEINNCTMVQNSSGKHEIVNLNLFSGTFLTLIALLPDNCDTGGKFDTYGYIV